MSSSYTAWASFDGWVWRWGWRAGDLAYNRERKRERGREGGREREREREREVGGERNAFSQSRRPQVTLSRVNWGGDQQNFPSNQSEIPFSYLFEEEAYKVDPEGIWQTCVSNFGWSRPTYWEVQNTEMTVLSRYVACLSRYPAAEINW